jgi:signal peptidase complex subunit 1
MDWQGQKLSEHLMQYLLLGSAIIAFLAGYLTSSYSTMLCTYLAGVIVTFLVTVPDWPFYNRKPLHWLEPMYADMPSTRQINKSKQQPLPSSGKKAAKPQGKR